MDIINFGSINLDYVYGVDKIVNEGETVPASSREIFFGGKGLNQSIACARAGGKVFHVGTVGKDGVFILDYLMKSGVNVDHVVQTDAPQGHAMIQVDKNGNNSIIVFPGSNHQLTRESVDNALASFTSGSFLMLQNEISNVDYIIDRAYELGFKIVFNASPIDSSILKLPLEKITWLMINETEGAAMSGCRKANDILDYFKTRCPETGVVLTLGKDGVICQQGEERIAMGVYKTEVVDTTAAGDTFSGFFVASLADGKTAPEALKIASAASAIAISKKGASPSIPEYDEVEKLVAKGEMLPFEIKD